MRFIGELEKHGRVFDLMVFFSHIPIIVQPTCDYNLILESLVVLKKPWRF